MDERTALIGFIVLGVVGAGIFLSIGTTHAIDVGVSHGKGAATDTAESFLESRGYDVSGYSSTAIFASRTEPGTYIQRNLPIAEIRPTFRSHSIYVWEVRFYEPLNQTEFYVDVDPTTGEVVGFERNLPEEAAGDRLSTDAAASKARAFLSARGYDLSKYEPIQNGSTDRPNRRDHTFAWRHRTAGVADAPLEVEVTVQGDRVGAYEERLNVPDDFSHQFEIQQNRNDLLGAGATFVLVLLVLVTIGFGIRYYRQRAFDLRLALSVGGVSGAVVFADQLNSVPGTLHGMPTTTTHLQYLAQNAIGWVISAIVVGVIIGVLVGAGIKIAREYGDKPLLGTADAQTTVRTLKRSTIRGFAVGWGMLGFVTLFYWVGAQHFDVWLPVGTPYTDAMSTFLPVVGVLTVGLLPALLEELVFRAVGISLGQRYLRSTVVAVAVTAMVWAFGHSQYVVLPPYARFVELTILGILLGWLFLRYDLTTVVSAHFTFNASLTAVPMLLAGLPFVIANGVVGVVIASLPLLVGVAMIGYDRHSPGRLEELLTPEQVATETVLTVLETTEEHVLTTAEVADEVGVTEDVAREELESLVEGGDVEKKSVGDTDAVWWLAD